MTQPIVVIAASEILSQREILDVQSGGAAYYENEAFAILRHLWQKFGLSKDWKTAQVVILVTSLCGCCGGDKAVTSAAKKLRSQGFTGYVLVRTVGDEEVDFDATDLEWLEWSKDESAEKMVERAEELTRKPVPA
jgi:hypothetical protein